MKLDVQVQGQTVASLYRERDEYLLEYLPDTHLQNFVSLAMPVRKAPWRWPRDLHPFFRQNLPEGYLLNIIREEFGPLLDGTDLSLLALVGGSGIGRVTVTPEDSQPGIDLQPLQIDQLLTADNTAGLFDSLVRRYARSAISGMVPKFIAPEKTKRRKQDGGGRTVLRTKKYIVKGSDSSTPFLGFNEYYSMRVLERINTVPVARTHLSRDGQVLVVERFDVDGHGTATHGVEDACGLLGLPPHEKYATSMEKVLNAMRPYLPAANRRTQMEHFGWHMLTNFVVRNADCHAKNIALYYTGADDVCFTPIYDIVTTQAYPRYAANPPSLSIEGRKTWMAAKTLQRFFTARLGISPQRYNEMVEMLCDSAVCVGKEVIEASRNEQRWRPIAKQMLHAWNEGMTTLRNRGASVSFQGLDTAITAAGFSAPEPPEQHRTVIGRSELLAPKAGKR